MRVSLQTLYSRLKLNVALVRSQVHDLANGAGYLATGVRRIALYISLLTMPKLHNPCGSRKESILRGNMVLDATKCVR